MLLRARERRAGESGDLARRSETSKPMTAVMSPPQLLARQSRCCWGYAAPPEWVLVRDFRICLRLWPDRRSWARNSRPQPDKDRSEPASAIYPFPGPSTDREPWSTSPSATLYLNSARRHGDAYTVGVGREEALNFRGSAVVGKADGRRVADRRHNSPNFAECMRA